jgi:hypothetical protein
METRCPVCFSEDVDLNFSVIIGNAPTFKCLSCHEAFNEILTVPRIYCSKCGDSDVSTNYGAESKCHCNYCFNTFEPPRCGQCKSLDVIGTLEESRNELTYRCLDCDKINFTSTQIDLSGNDFDDLDIDSRDIYCPNCKQQLEDEGNYFYCWDCELEVNN